MLIKSEVSYFNDCWIPLTLLIYYSVDSNRYFGGYYLGFQDNVQLTEKFFFLLIDFISFELAIQSLFKTGG